MSSVIESIRATDIHRSALLSEIPGIAHGITRRVSGAGRADGNVGYSAPRDRADAWEMRRSWLDAAQLDAAAIVVAYQVHGNVVVRVGAEDAGKGADPDSRPLGQADALVTDRVGPVLMTLHADCMPILVCDPVKRVVAAAHAGWRGTALNVAGAVVRTMVTHYGSEPADLVACLGPGIGSCCYEVQDDVVEAWSACLPGSSEALRPVGGRWRFDLKVANRQLLERAGVRPERIEASGVCTKCNGEQWFSHRGQGPATGRYAAFIALIDDDPSRGEA